MSSPTEHVPARESTEHVRELVARGQQGDREALEELYLIHFDRIYSYLHVSVGNRHDAEDLTTQTFLKMLEKIGSFKWQSGSRSPQARRSPPPSSRRCRRSAASRC